jgi:cytochrome c-type biogenesis protein CcmH/NrfG
VEDSETTNPRNGNHISKKSIEDFEFLLAHHDSQIASVKGEVGEIKNKLDTVINAVSALNNALTLASSKNPFNLPAALSVVRDGAIVLGLAVSAIIYVTTGHFSADWARQAEFNNLVKERLNTLSKSQSVP